MMENYGLFTAIDLDPRNGRLGTSAIGAIDIF